MRQVKQLSNQQRPQGRRSEEAGEQRHTRSGTATMAHGGHVEQSRKHGRDGVGIYAAKQKHKSAHLKLALHESLPLDT